MLPKSLFPCLWFDQQAPEAVEFYCSLFPESRITGKNEFTFQFELMGTHIQALNGGPMYQQTPACSYFVYCGEQASIEELYQELKKGGQVIFPLDSYPWSSRYAWVTDRFGTNWQLDIDPIRSPQKIVPCLLFVNDKRTRVKEAIEFYLDVFSNSRSLMEAPLPDSEDLLFAQIKLDQFILNLMSSPESHDYDFTPANSLVITCPSQAEIDYFWEKLGDGGQFQRCGWLKDRFGVSWQIVPADLGKILADPQNGKKSMEALLSMEKLLIEKLKNPF